MNFKMKAAALLSLSIAGLILVVVCAGDKTECAKCGRNMVAVGCECNQVCNAKEPRICSKRLCPNTCDVCACNSGFCLPHANSKHCVKEDKCHH